MHGLDAMVDAMDAKTVAIVVLSVALAVILFRRLLIIRRDNLCQRLFGFKPNPHDPAGNAELMKQEIDKAFSQVCSADHDVQMTELTLQSAMVVANREKRRHRQMQVLARSLKVEFVWRRT